MAERKRRARFPAPASVVNALPRPSTAMSCARWTWPASRPCRPDMPSTRPSPRAAVQEGVVPGAGGMRGKGDMDF